MKRILTTIVLMVLFFPGLVLGETMDDLVQRDGLFYKKFTVVPFTGNITGETQGTIKNGKPEGPWIFYDGDRQLWKKGNYKKGKRDGPWVFYHLNGQLEKKGTYKDGKKEGNRVFYDSDGSEVVVED